MALCSFRLFYMLVCCLILLHNCFCFLPLKTKSSNASCFKTAQIMMLSIHYSSSSSLFFITEVSLACSGILISCEGPCVWRPSVSDLQQIYWWWWWSWAGLRQSHREKHPYPCVAHYSVNEILLNTALYNAYTFFKKKTALALCWLIWLYVVNRTMHRCCITCIFNVYTFL